MRMKMIKVLFKDLDFSVRNTPKLRGAVASKFPGYTLLHHHINEKRLLYLYPRIQYKIINHMPMIVGIDDGIDVLKKIYSDINELKINGITEPTTQSEIQIVITEEHFGASDDLIEYEFKTSWMALNQGNYKKFTVATKESKDRLLKSILVGNILSLSKSLKYTVDTNILAKIKLEKSEVKFKNSKMITFYGGFIVNFNIPNYLGLGKSVARGFGTIKRIKD